MADTEQSTEPWVEPRYTPGPWSESWVRPDLSMGHTFDPRCSILAACVEHGGNVLVADIPDPLSPEEEANARLIASAPELLESLICIVNALERPSLTSPRGVMTHVPGAIERARVAINKVLGVEIDLAGELVADSASGSTGRGRPGRRR